MAPARIEQKMLAPSTETALLLSSVPASRVFHAQHVLQRAFRTFVNLQSLVLKAIEPSFESCFFNFRKFAFHFSKVVQELEPEIASKGCDEGLVTCTGSGRPPEVELV